VPNAFPVVQYGQPGFESVEPDLLIPELAQTLPLIAQLQLPPPSGRDAETPQERSADARFNISHFDNFSFRSVSGMAC
jgi:hypothetical protein